MSELFTNVSKLNKSSIGPDLTASLKRAIPRTEYINVINAKSAPMLNNAGKETINANRSLRIPLAA